MSHQSHTILYEGGTTVTPFYSTENEAESDPPQVSPLVGGGARTVTLACGPPDPWAPRHPWAPCRPRRGWWLAVYLAAELAEPASSLAPPAALAGPFPPRPGAPAGAPGAVSGGCGWIPSSGAPLWPVGKSGGMEA